MNAQRERGEGRDACNMKSFSADMWSRVSQRRICAGVCHPKTPPQRVSLTYSHDTRMMKQAGVYAKPEPACGISRGHKQLA